MNRFSTFAPAVALLGGLLLISGVREQYQTQPAQPMKAIPLTLMGQTGRDQVIDSVERKVAGMSDYVMRSFGKDSLYPEYSLYVGYYDRQVQGKTIHSPRNCLPGAGWEIMSSSQIPVPGGTPGTINRVILANSGVRALVYYWYQGRGRIESSEYRVKWDLLRDAAMYGRTEEALVRIVVAVAPPTPGTMPKADDAPIQAADVTARRVAEEVTPMVAKVLPAFPGA
jgi:EpsI family protein